MNLGAASAAPLAKVGRSEFPRDMKTHGSPQETARARRDVVQGNWFRNGFRKCFRNPRPFGPWQAVGGAPRWLFVEGAANLCRDVLVCLLCTSDLYFHAVDGGVDHVADAWVRQMPGLILDAV